MRNKEETQKEIARNKKEIAIDVLVEISIIAILLYLNLNFASIWVMSASGVLGLGINYLFNLRAEKRLERFKNWLSAKSSSG